jgi:hypothetical protein
VSSSHGLRSQFAAALAGGGPQALVANLNTRADALLAR